MFRFSIVVLVLAIGCVALAADKYTVPPHPAVGAAKCSIAFDAGSPTTVKGQQNGWTVTGTGKYNYDNA
ncbi:MAG: hypothetical protein K2X82_05685 [Gemmataceae bacterium]|nr:hypothetical protein [Gemmataceae bacterium]